MSYSATGDNPGKALEARHTMDGTKELEWQYRMGMAGADFAHNYTVPILCQTSPTTMELLGTGALFQVGNHRFLITASHVIEEAEKNGWPLGIVDFPEIKQPTGTILLMGEFRYHPFMDFAIHKLHPGTLAHIKHRRFFSMKDVDVKSVQQGRFFWLGYPRSHTDRIEGTKEFHFSPFMYSGPLFTGSTIKNPNFDPVLHIAVDRSQHQLTDFQGNVASLPSELQGISGAMLLQTSQESMSPERWSPDQIRIVGLVLGCDHDYEHFYATRWGVVVPVIWHFFPEVRPALMLNFEHPQVFAGKAVTWPHRKRSTVVQQTTS